MQITVTTSGCFKVLGWMVVAALFAIPILIFFGVMFGGPDAGYIVLGLVLIFVKTWYLLPIPLGIFCWGMWQSAKSGVSGGRATMQWLAISLAAYIAVFVVGYNVLF